MGTLPVSGELNQRLRPILANISNATIIQDDIVIATNDLISHNTVTRTYAGAEPIERVLRFRQYRDGRNVIL